jgi:ferredoxin
MILERQIRHIRQVITIAAIKNFFNGRKRIAILTKAPILGKMIDHMFFEGDDIIILPKDDVVRETITLNKEIKRPADTMLPTQVLKHFINKAEDHWIMNFCICRHANNTKDYPVELGCLFLGEAVNKIDPAVGKLVSKEDALEHVEKCKAAGLVPLIGRNKIDDVWLNTGPKEKLMTICFCDPQSCLWRMLPDLSTEISSKVTKMPFVDVTVNVEKCIGCGKCTKNVCYVNAISLIDNKAQISNLCRACGRCVEVCPQNAIEIKISHPEKSIQQSIDRLEPLMDLKKKN